MTRSLWSYSKDEATDFNNNDNNNNNNNNNNIAHTNHFKFFMYKAKLLINTVTDGVNGIFRNTNTVVPIKHLSNFWRSLKVPLINSKVEFKWTKHYVLASAGTENAAANTDNIIFYYHSHKIICPCCQFMSKNVLENGSKYQCIGMNVEQKVRLETR